MFVKLKEFYFNFNTKQLISQDIWIYNREKSVYNDQQGGFLKMKI